MRFLLVALCALALAACGKKQAPHPIVADEATKRSVASGEIIGYRAENGAHAWRGVPYAASTAGENRWRAPQPAPSWSDVREALEFSERCPQLTNAFSAGEGYDPGILIGSEDCLKLDIYAPADAAGKSLPVMVWIHGGGNVWGASKSYDGSNLARNEDVIIVAVQYRLGPLGWFSHALLREEDPEIGANFGTRDLIASLEWVRDNISAFGGNPENVTIFGESAGGHNVVTLLASPLATGLFHRAIIQSGSFDSLSIDEAENGADRIAPNPSRTIVKALGATTAAGLRAASVEAVYGAYELDEAGYLSLPLIIEDGVVLPEGRLREAFNATESFNATPIMTGTNRDEMKLFYMLDPRLTKRMFGAFIVARDQDFYDAASDYSSRIWRIRSVDGPTARMNAAGHDAVFAYRFDWDEGGRFLFMDLAKVLGAAHAIEIPFVFNRFQLLGDADKIMWAKKTRASREKLSRSMGAYWAAFARDGEPGDAGSPFWPRYSVEGATLMRFDSEAGGGPEVMQGADSLDRLAADLKSDPRLDDAERCLIVAGIGEWVPSVEGLLSAEIGCN